ncbi:MAG: hypothetical protein SH847_22975 [Roseiflexaceae bacterium]|nr:hypothetical protein [Roseiflexaceae bacterium]
MRLRRWSGCLVALILLSSAIVISVMMVGSGRMNLPQMTVDLGVAQFILSTATLPLCPQQVPCVSQLPRPVLRIATAWIVLPPRAGQSSQMIKLFSVSRRELDP